MSKPYLVARGMGARVKWSAEPPVARGWTSAVVCCSTGQVLWSDSEVDTAELMRTHAGIMRRAAEEWMRGQAARALGL